MPPHHPQIVVEAIVVLSWFVLSLSLSLSHVRGAFIFFGCFGGCSCGTFSQKGLTSTLCSSCARAISRSALCSGSSVEQVGVVCGCVVWWLSSIVTCSNLAVRLPYLTQNTDRRRGQTGTHTETHTHKQTHAHTNKHTHTQTQTHTHTRKYKQTRSFCFCRTTVVGAAIDFQPAITPERVRREGCHAAVASRS